MAVAGWQSPLRIWGVEHVELPWPAGPADRLYWSWLSRIWSAWPSALVLVEPETVIHWQRTSWWRYWAWRSKGCRSPGASAHPPERSKI